MPVTTTTTELLFRPDPHTLGFLPEGPQRVAPGIFSWVGIQHGASSTTGSLNRFDLSTGEQTQWPLPGRPGFALPTQDFERFLIGMERELGLWDVREQRFETLVSGIDHEVQGTLINDGQAATGGCLFGCKELTFSKPQAGLYWYPYGSDQVIRLRDDQICSNGKVVLGETPEELQFLDIDTPTRCVREYRVELPSGRIREERVALDLADQPGFPDGMIGTPDGSGVIVALFNPEGTGNGLAKWFDLATGEERQHWITPDSPQVTCPLLIDHEGSIKLVLTTAAENMEPDRLAACPQAGGLFLGETSFDELPELPTAIVS